MPSSPNKTIIWLVVVLLTIAAAGLVALLLLPAASVTPDNQPSAATTSSLETNSRVFQAPDYTSLNKQLINDGSLPVQPPAQAGKTNPFL
ncbi:MAG: hypothetical protein Q8P73_03545 [bacterium]|nr:hypothetical protein [bacterium]MDZ4344934.1 hypothetical protein [Candidatus Binatia bacterium]